MLNVSPTLCVSWLVSECFLMLAMRVFISGEWRAHLPGMSNFAMSLGAHLTLYLTCTFAVGTFSRLTIGPALWALFTACCVAMNSVMVACALSLEERPRGPEFHMYLWALVGVAYVLVVVGWAMAWSSITPEKRKDFFQNESLKQYLERKWDTRTASRTGWGEGLDAARAHVVMSWSRCYWPKEKVNKWLKEGWRSWQRHPPKWFDVKVRALRMYRNYLQQNLELPHPPRAATGRLSPTHSRSPSHSCALPGSGERSSGNTRQRGCSLR